MARRRDPFRVLDGDRQLYESESLEDILDFLGEKTGEDDDEEQGWEDDFAW